MSSNNVRELYRRLQASVDDREVIKVVRRPKAKLDPVTGFPVLVSKDLLLVHEMHPDWFALNGYWCLRLRDIAHIDPVGEADRFIGRAVLFRGLEPVVPEGIALTSMAEFLRTAGERSPLVAVHREHIRPGKCYIGKVLRVGRKRVTLRTIDPDAAWDTNEKLRMSDVTLASFDDGYTRMLWQVNQAFHNTLLAHTPSVGTA